jgi:hypothetical protein
VTAPGIVSVTPRGRARYRWCQNKEE